MHPFANTLTTTLNNYRKEREKRNNVKIRTTIERERGSNERTHRVITQRHHLKHRTMAEAIRSGVVVTSLAAGERGKRKKKRKRRRKKGKR